MTRDDRKSTEDATASSVMAAMVAGQLTAAAAFGLPAAQLARAAGLREEDLSDPDGRIPFERCVSLWEAIEADPRGQDFGFWLGRSVTVETLGVVGFAMQHAPDVRSAFRCMNRFRKLMNDAVSPHIEEEGDRVIMRLTEPPRTARLTAMAVAGPVGTLTLIRALTGQAEDRVLAVEAAFQHPPPPNAHRYEEELRCPIVFNAPTTHLVLPRAVFDLPLRRTDPGLYRYLEQHASALEARLPDRTSVATQVRQHLIESIRDGEPEQREVARRLAMSERTLQRRLRDENTTFAALVDEVRMELARMYLADGRLAVFEVAFLLGFSEPSAFNRAFRRWTNLSPRDYRRSVGIGE
jgi:AraC-like DNA-binding protein